MYDQTRFAAATSHGSRLATVVLAILVMVPAAGCQVSLGSGPSDGQGAGTSPGAGRNGGETGGGGRAGGAGVSSSPEPTTTAGSFTGTVDARPISGRIPEVVNCDSISSDITVTASGGRARWTAVPKRGANFADQGATGVATQPSSGELDAGRSTVVHVSGTLDPNNSQNKSGKQFYVLLEYRDGAGARGVEFRCR